METHGASSSAGYAGVKPLSTTILPMTLSHALLAEATRIVPRFRVFLGSRTSDAAVTVNDIVRRSDKKPVR
jgi:hypothetical protein